MTFSLNSDSPAHPSKFRTTYYRARYYVDNLPAGGAWGHDDDRYPSVTAVKSAMNKAFMKRLPSGNTYPLDAVRSATAAMQNVAWLATQPQEDGVEFCANKAGADLRNAGKRGSGVHDYIEGKLSGRPMLPGMVPVESEPYIDTVDRMIDELDIKPVYIEHVVFNREVGYAGTFDLIGHVGALAEGPLCLIDWKTRAAESNHGAYAEEAMQLGAYAAGQYLITEQDGVAVRVPVPDIKMGLVVSIKPDGYEPYEVDLHPASEAADLAVDCWRAKREAGQWARKSVAKNPLVIAARAPAPEPNVRRDTAVRRCKALVEAGHGQALATRWPEGVPTLKESEGQTDDDLHKIFKSCAAVEALFEIPFPSESDEDPDRRTARQKQIERRNPSEPSVAAPDAGSPGSSTSRTMTIDEIADHFNATEV